MMKHVTLIIPCARSENQVILQAVYKIMGEQA